jgi:hypothetical protein
MLSENGKGRKFVEIIIIGTQERQYYWIPAYAGMTRKKE